MLEPGVFPSPGFLQPLILQQRPGKQLSVSDSTAIVSAAKRRLLYKQVCNDGSSWCNLLCLQFDYKQAHKRALAGCQRALYIARCDKGLLIWRA